MFIGHSVAPDVTKLSNVFCG